MGGLTFPNDSTKYDLDALFFAIGNGDINGAYYVTISSYKKGVSTSVLDDITLIPGVTVLPYPNGQQLRVVSDSANDSASGTGIRQVHIHYLDSGYNEQSETITLTGLTAVNTVATNIYRINGFHALSIGANGVAVGNISLQNTGGTVTYDYIEAGGNNRLTCHFTAPNNKLTYVVGWESTSVKQAMSVRLRMTRDPNSGILIPGVFLFHAVVNLQNSASGYRRFVCPIKCVPRTDIKISALGGTANGDCSGSLDIVVMNNEV